jgi:hypothetical protein
MGISLALMAVAAAGGTCAGVGAGDTMHWRAQCVFLEPADNLRQGIRIEILGFAVKVREQEQYSPYIELYGIGMYLGLLTEQK